jgi:hypothetical protein
MHRQFGDGGVGTLIPTLVDHVQLSGGLRPKASEDEVGSVRVTIVAVQQRQQVLHNPSVCLQPKLSGMQSECAILSSVAYSDSTIFSPVVINGTIFAKINI